jgi:hypothetical protein
MIYLALFLLFFFIGACVAYDRHRHPHIFPYHDPNIPFTSDELKQMGIVLPDPERYDCETFVR